MVVSEPGLGLPQFIFTVHLDGQLLASYDSERKNGGPLEPSMEKPSPILNITIFLGFHTLQWLFGCELSQDGLKAGVNKFSYDGKEALSFEDSLNWTAYDPVGQEYKREYESEPGRTQCSNHSWEEICISMWCQLLKTDKKEWPRRGEAGEPTITC
uniref:Major histocompatibility complex class I-related gene protein-like n=1 Tax=Pogona vitticeps TaxID=103695 RepID=A0ABM5FKX3_9SAUR